MKTTPWAKLTMRMMPKISVSPHAMKNRIEACESALRHCARMKPNQFIGDLARTLVSRFRRSYPFASRTHTNVGTKGTAGGPTGCGPPARKASPVAVTGAPAIRRRHLARIDLDDLADRLGELLVLGDLHHEALVLALVVAFAHQHRSLDAGDVEPLHRPDDLHWLGGARLLDGGEQDHQRLVHLAVGPVRDLVLVFGLEGGDERPVFRNVVGDGKARGAD